jgi:hypothetical protein
MFEATPTRKSRFSIDMTERTLLFKDVPTFIQNEKDYTVHIVRHHRGSGFGASVNPTMYPLRQVALDAELERIDGFLIKFKDPKRKSILSEGFFFSCDRTDLILKEERGDAFYYKDYSQD